ncbi:MAG: alpha/beta fold hydrolase [Acidimicrobiia bacterium]|nr:alpha/beta fold hydrolase [Acidimicrobiia bacterium]
MGRFTITKNADGATSLATRTEGEVRTGVGFIAADDESNQQLFVSVSLPAGRARSGVVICPPLHADFAKNYRNEVLLAAGLARAGHSVIRFHYRGQGNSDGDPREMTLESLKADARAAAEYLVATTGVRDVGFVGCRLGGFVAAAAASIHDRSPVALWEPVLKPAAYLKEAVRARMIGSMAAGSDDRISAASLNERLATEGSLDIYGYPIHLGLVRSLERTDLRSQLGTSSRPLLLVQISAGSDLRADYARFIDEIGSQGFEAVAKRVSATVGWWFRGAGRDRDQPDLISDETVSTTVDWLGSQFPPDEVGR